MDVSLSQVSLENVKASNGLRYLLPDKLGFIAIAKNKIPDLQKELSLQTANITCISSDLHSQYLPLGSDFGPVNLGVIYRFCKSMVKRMSSLHRGYFCDKKKAFVSVRDGAFIYCFEPEPKATSNACFLLGSFLIVEFQMNPQDAANFFIGPGAPFEVCPFRDSSSEPDSSTISLLDCFLGLKKAISQGWFDVRTFKVETYETLDDPLCGDIHQICPKLVAFRGPRDVLSPDDDAFETSHCIELLKKLAVTCVVRLSSPDDYDREQFVRAGMTHIDLPCPDPFPSDDVIERFITLCDHEKVVAVHCRTGLGRTGTLAALWMMRYKQFAAREAVAWARIVRTGSISAAQQDFLAHCEGRRWVGSRLAAPRRGAPSLQPWLTQPAGPRPPSPCRPVDPDSLLDDSDEEDTSPAASAAPAANAANADGPGSPGGDPLLSRSSR